MSTIRRFSLHTRQEQDQDQDKINSLKSIRLKHFVKKQLILSNTIQPSIPITSPSPTTAKNPISKKISPTPTPSMSVPTATLTAIGAFISTSSLPPSTLPSSISSPSPSPPLSSQIPITPSRNDDINLDNFLIVSSISLVISVLLLITLGFRYRHLSIHASSKHYYLQIFATFFILLGSIISLTQNTSQIIQIFTLLISAGFIFSVQSFHLYTLAMKGSKFTISPAAASVAQSVSKNRLIKNCALSIPHILFTICFILSAIIPSISSDITFLSTLFFTILIFHYSTRILLHAYLRRNALYPKPLKPFSNPIFYIFVFSQLLSLIITFVIGPKKLISLDNWILPLAFQLISNYFTLEFLHSSGIFIKNIPNKLRGPNDIYIIKSPQYNHGFNSKKSPSDAIRGIPISTPFVALSTPSPGINNFEILGVPNIQDPSKVSSIYRNIPPSFPAGPEARRMSRIELPELVIVRDRLEKDRKESDPGRRRILGLSIGGGNKKRDSEQSWGDRLSRISWWGV